MSAPGEPTLDEPDFDEPYFDDDDQDFELLLEDRWEQRAIDRLSRSEF